MPELLYLKNSTVDDDHGDAARVALVDEVRPDLELAERDEVGTDAVKEGKTIWQADR